MEDNPWKDHDRERARDERRDQIRQRLSEIIAARGIHHRRRLEAKELPEDIVSDSAWRHALLDAVAQVIEEETGHE